MIGKQLVGKKAEYAGDDVSKQTRKFGVVYIPTLVDIDDFKSYFKKYGGTVASENSYPANGSTFGDSTVSEEQAPTIVTRMKSAGVTTVIMLSDFSMNKALMDNATKQEWFPEWFFTGAIYADIGILSRAYPTEQSRARVRPVVPHPVHRARPAAAAAATSVVDPDRLPELVLGRGRRHAGRSGQRRTFIWLLSGIQTAGPKLTPKTFAQGLFAIPASGGAAQNRTNSFLSGYGKVPDLPYDEYAENGLDFAPYWWDPDTTGPSNGQGELGKGVGWYANGAKRYMAGTWPKKQFDWFDKDTSVYHFETAPDPGAHLRR